MNSTKQVGGRIQSLDRSNSNYLMPTKVPLNQVISNSKILEVDLRTSLAGLGTSLAGLRSMAGSSDPWPGAQIHGRELIISKLLDIFQSNGSMNRLYLNIHQISLKSSLRPPVTVPGIPTLPPHPGYTPPRTRRCTGPAQHCPYPGVNMVVGLKSVAQVSSRLH